MRDVNLQLQEKSQDFETFTEEFTKLFFFFFFFFNSYIILYQNSKLQDKI